MEDEQPVDAVFLDAADRQAHQVLNATGVRATYDAGMGFMGVCMGGMDATASGYLPHVPAGLYQVWGALTYEVDAPGRGSPEQDEAAMRHMKQAAAEWLEVSRIPDKRLEYLDRWVYDECGYERPASG